MEEEFCVTPALLVVITYIKKVTMAASVTSISILVQGSISHAVDG